MVKENQFSLKIAPLTEAVEYNNTELVKPYATSG
jgi:hypothetical protein